MVLTMDIDKSPQLRAMWRIVGGSIATCFFVLIQIGFIVYFAIFPHHLTPVSHLVDIFGIGYF